MQIFDSWAGGLPEDEFARWCSYPTRAIVAGVKAEAPDVPVIGFPRGAGALAEVYARETGLDAIGCDTGMPLGFMRETLQSRLPVQGNLDPLLLLAGGKHLEARVVTILNTLGGAALRVQSRPRHSAGDAAGACGAARRACEKRQGLAIAMLLSYIKAFHVIAIIAWMAGLLYLPRLFVYHADSAKGSQQSETFKVMERRLLRLITTPAMIASWIFGLILAFSGRDQLVGGWLVPREARAGGAALGLSRPAREMDEGLRHGSEHHGPRVSIAW